MIDFLNQPENLLVFKAISRLFLISCLGYLAVRLQLLSARTIEYLSQFVIVVTLPCLILSTLGRELRYDLLPEMAGCLVGAILLGDTAITSPLKHAIETGADFSGLLKQHPTAGDVAAHLAAQTR